MLRLMAKQVDGFMGGFKGRLGPVIGYCWNGKWCMRSKPGAVNNPRTEAQEEHRRAFKEQVQLAAQMRMVVTASLTLVAREFGMTSYNLFVSMNKEAFAGGGVDYSLLRVSMGAVAPVAFGRPSLEGNVLTVNFESNPLGLRADNYDGVRVYAYCPELKTGFLSAPVYRRTKRISVLLPDGFEGRELHLYGFVQAEDGQCSESSYIPCTAATEEAQEPVNMQEEVIATPTAEAPAGIVTSKRKPSQDSGPNSAVG